MILVTGAKGMVGSYVEEAFADEEVLLTDLPEMNITDKEKVFSLVSKYNPEFVLHLAAETDVDKCQTQIDHAFRTNALGTYNVALACQKYNSIMVYISTGGVFSGKSRQVHTEFDKPLPSNIYSSAKLEGEKALSQLLDRFYIFRAGWMIGGGPLRDKKFIGKMLELCKTRKSIEVVDDKFGSPTFARDFISAVSSFIKTGNFGTYHLVNPEPCTRFEIAKEMVRLLGLDIEVKPVSSDRFPLPAPRSPSEAMRNYKMELLGFNLMPNWKESLKRYLKEWDDASGKV